MDLRASNLALATLLRDETSAGTRVSPTFDHKRGLPQIAFDTVGETPWRGYSPGTSWRVAVRCYARDLDSARKLYGEVRSVLLPVEDAAYGYHGAVTVTLDGQSRTVNFSGIQHNAGPNELEDLPTGTPMLESYWLVPHY